VFSFVVPAYNEARILPRTLAAMHAAARALDEAYEIVVADDASSDDTAAVATAHGARVVSVAHRQIAATRNAGARAASGQFLIFVDADTWVNTDVVGATLAALRAGAVGGGAAIAFDGEVPRYARLMQPMMTAYFRLARWAAGCYVFCTRTAFDAVGGFDEAYFGAEEIVMSRALKRHGRFVVLRERVLTSGRKLRTHSPRELLSAVWRLARQGRTGVQQREGMDLWYAERRDDPAQRD
jgi:glycosyltransferase involved in cell wall biosynthesis